MIDGASAASDCSRAWVEINLRALRANVQSLTAILAPGLNLMAVVKADAYGHGLIPAAQNALHAGAVWLGVATTAEGVALRAAGISAPIALLCMPAPEEVRLIAACRLTALIGDAEIAGALSEAAGSASRLDVHLDVDTGMGRSGVLPEGTAALFLCCRQAGLNVTGICTHFADAEGLDPQLTLAQWARFAEARRSAEAVGACFEWIHAGNSAAALRFAPNGCNLVRPGLLLYGLRPTVSLSVEERQAVPPEQRSPDEETRESVLLPTLRPVLALRARVGAVRELPAGHTISYGATCRLTRRSRVATVLIGYGDGYPRRLSNCGDMLVRGRRAPILGRVCMDQTVVDVTDIADATAGDVVTCIGRDGTETITVEAIARLIRTTEHEITTCLTARLPRVYNDNAATRVSRVLV